MAHGDLYFVNVQFDDSGRYFCVAHNQYAVPSSRTSPTAIMTVEGGYNFKNCNFCVVSTKCVIVHSHSKLHKLDNLFKIKLLQAPMRQKNIVSSLVMEVIPIYFRATSFYRTTNTNGCYQRPTATSQMFYTSNSSGNCNLVQGKH